MREYDGRHPDVAAYIRQDPDFENFIERLKAWLLPLLPRYLHEGKHHLTIAIGCTGGKHRSVYLTEVFAEIIAQAGYEVSARHREIARGTT